MKSVFLSKNNYNNNRNNYERCTILAVFVYQKKSSTFIIWNTRKYKFLDESYLALMYWQVALFTERLQKTTFLNQVK